MVKDGEARGLRIVHNRLLGGWYVVRGPHHAPISGKFSSRAEAEHWLKVRKARDLIRENIAMEKR